MQNVLKRLGVATTAFLLLSLFSPLVGAAAEYIEAYYSETEHLVYSIIYTDQSQRPSIVTVDIVFEDPTKNVSNLPVSSPTDVTFRNMTTKYLFSHEQVFEKPKQLKVNITNSGVRQVLTPEVMLVDEIPLTATASELRATQHIEESPYLVAGYAPPAGMNKLVSFQPKHAKSNTIGILWPYDEAGNSGEGLDFVDQSSFVLQDLTAGRMVEIRSYREERLAVPNMLRHAPNYSVIEFAEDFVPEHHYLLSLSDQYRSSLLQERERGLHLPPDPSKMEVQLGRVKDRPDAAQYESSSSFLRVQESITFQGLKNKGTICIAPSALGVLENGEPDYYGDPQLQVKWCSEQSAAPQTPPSNSPGIGAAFADVRPDHWAYEDIEWAVNSDITTGFVDGTFKPDRNVTYSEFLTFLLRAYGIHLRAGADQKWYEPAILKAKEYDWVLFESDLENPVNRGQVAQLLANASGLQYSIPDAVQYVLDEKISNGKASSTVEGYHASDLLTRAEAVKFIRTFVDKNDSLKKAGKEPIDPAQPRETDMSRFLGSWSGTIEPSPSNKGSRTSADIGFSIRQDGEGYMFANGYFDVSSFGIVDGVETWQGTGHNDWEIDDYISMDQNKMVTTIHFQNGSSTLEIEFKERQVVFKILNFGDGNEQIKQILNNGIITFSKNDN